MRFERGASFESPPLPETTPQGELHGSELKNKWELPSLELPSVPDNGLPKLDLPSNPINVLPLLDLPTAPDCFAANSHDISNSEKSLKKTELFTNDSNNVEVGDQSDRDPENKSAQDVSEKRMEPPVNCSFRCPDSCDKDEYERQVKGQENGINNLSIGEYLRNRENFRNNGRDTKEGSAAQQRARQEARADKVTEFRKAGMSREEAEQAADDWLKTQAALHDPDQIAGGNPNHVTGMGDRAVNSSIGAQWRGQADDLEAAVRKYINENNLSDEELNTIKMNVILNVE